ncbi:sulfotransferase family protein [Marinobacter sp. DUT-1]|uniref:sulfotransferase family protein n=1 Tax=Marinobacter sp. DUT-1 TaxID=3412037 RepID=UPI003D18668B
MKTVDFIIVGAMKSGTTSLHHWLMLSDQIYMKKQEIHFFDRADRYAENLERYNKFLGLDESVDDNVRVGDDTPSYSYVQEVPCRIHKVCPRAKIIWILRDPLERSISQYWHSMRRGGETRNIDQAFRDELEGRETDKWKLYLYRSKYLWQIKNYLEYFDQSQMLFVDFEEFVSGGGSERKKVTDFLEVEEIESPAPHSNKTVFFPRPKINQVINSLGVLPEKVALGIRAVSGYRRITRPRLSEEVAVAARKYLEEDIEELSKITGLKEYRGR